MLKLVARKEVVALIGIIYVITFMKDYRLAFDFLDGLGINLFETAFLGHIVYVVVGVLMKVIYVVFGIWTTSKVGKLMYAVGMIIGGILLF